MIPTPGSRLLRFVGDAIRFEVRDELSTPPPDGWKAMLRTNVGRASMLRREIIEAHTRGMPPAGAAWRDLPMQAQADGSWALTLPLAEPGFFKAKAYLVDPRGWQHWPQGPDAGISVHPDRYRTANTIYCAFTRLFGETKCAVSTVDPKKEKTIGDLDERGYAVIPPSGKLRDLIKTLPHIFDTLGCRILHLLPIHPTPTTFARFGRYGSPYAALDLTAIDPALVDFDKRTTGIDQFRELTYESHLRGGRVFLDIVINHTGWGSVLHENRPDWFLRHSDGTFASPGAWGTVWEDLVELKHDNVKLWDQLASMFLTWCRRGVDGFRCDAAYKVPMAAWQYIIARVQEEYPETIFLAEGLGGPWETTEQLLTEGGMQWAYSELFQNYTGQQVSSYLRYSHAKSEQVGLYVHYSETHDNDRLAARGKEWSLLRNRLCALTSNNGGFGFTCGVEWLAPEKIKVHGCTGLAWDNKENIVTEIARLNRLLVDHPCFFDGALVSRLSPDHSPVYANRRRSEEGKDLVITLVNLDIEAPQTFSIRSMTSRHEPKKRRFFPLPDWVDLLGQKVPEIKVVEDSVEVTLEPGAAYCLSAKKEAQGLSGRDYREARARAAWATQALAQTLPGRAMPVYGWQELATVVDRSPSQFLAAIAHIEHELTRGDNGPGSIAAKFGTLELLESLIVSKPFPAVIEWSRANQNRITIIPPRHWFLVTDDAPFRASLQPKTEDMQRWCEPRLEPIFETQNRESIFCGGKHVACFPPRNSGADAVLLLERYAAEDKHISGTIRYLNTAPEYTPEISLPDSRAATGLVLLTNGRGGMARVCVDLGRIQSKYDCVLGANLDPDFPVDRHIFAKRIRAWVNADGFISPLNAVNLASFHVGPPAVWSFVANAGDGRTVEIELAANMIPGSNTTIFRMRRPTAADASGKQLPADADVRLTIRLDIEDRNFHTETHRNGGADYHFNGNCRPIVTGNFKLQTSNSSEGSNFKLQMGAEAQREEFCGFAFTPAAGRQMRAYCSAGSYHPQPEWSENIPHPVEQSRAHVGNGDAFSPGWFEVPLPKGADVTLVVTAEENNLGDVKAGKGELATGWRTRADKAVRAPFMDLFESREEPGRTAVANFEAQLEKAISAFVVSRDSGKTVIAGYPWFLDWGRDTFICARGLLAAGRIEDVRQIVVTFARFEKDGTLPNTIHGADASNRDTSDAPLWFALVCEELAQAEGDPEATYDHRVNGSRTLRDVLNSIAENYRRGTPNGIRMDSSSGLIWSPSHFTWMDTNYPAGTPREGYPIEIQALWIRLLRQVAKIGGAEQSALWQSLADGAVQSVEKLFWLEKQGYYSDLLIARANQGASEAVVDDALRSNCLFLISLGLASGERAKRCVQAALEHLVVPGALRTLAPLPVSVPLRVVCKDGYALNDPFRPYWGRYEGDEDTRRKPAYHNGTAWGWTFPTFCEALARTWDFSPEAVAAAKAYLGSMDRLLAEGCIGQLPEILDGDAPHQQRGCDAQAWSVTEALRVWKLLG